VVIAYSSSATQHYTRTAAPSSHDRAVDHFGVCAHHFGGAPEIDLTLAKHAASMGPAEELQVLSFEF
jgi:hypothetical protein